MKVHFVLGVWHSSTALSRSPAISLSDTLRLLEGLGTFFGVQRNAQLEKSGEKGCGVYMVHNQLNSDKNSLPSQTDG
jgi:hypothetical protein